MIVIRYYDKGTDGLLLRFGPSRDDGVIEASEHSTKEATEYVWPRTE